MKRNDIKSLLKARESRLQSRISEIKAFFKSAQEERDIPIYLVLERIKSEESIYFKSKLKSKSQLDQFTDLAGVRVLCICEQDLIATHSDFVKNLHQDFEIQEFTYFNWYEPKKEIRTAKFSENALRQKYPNCEIRTFRSQSGYKSIHYLVSATDRPNIGNNDIVEIQLRTLIQNVWSELEHKLAYKSGNWNSQITLGFQGIARHLTAIESVVSNIKDISDKEQVSAREYRSRYGPVLTFRHKEPSLDKQYRTKVFDQYEEHLAKRSKIKPIDFEDWKKRGKELFNVISKKITNEHVSSQYWKTCEEAYWEFCCGYPEKALETYKFILSKSEFRQYASRYKLDEYLIYFRIGEIHFSENRFSDAFDAFDQCEDLMPTDIEEEFPNFYKITVLLAYFYWRYRRSYGHISYKYMVKAEKWMSAEDNIKLSKIINGQLWYFLEMYWESKNRPIPVSPETADTQAKTEAEDIEKLKAMYEKLEDCSQILAVEDLNNNIYHTLACAAFELDLYNNQIDGNNYDGRYLEEAYEHAVRCVDLANGNAAYNLGLSQELQKNSVEKIFVSRARKLTSSLVRGS